MSKSRKVAWIVVRIALGLAITVLMLAMSYAAYIVSDGNDLMAGLIMMETPIAIIFGDMAAEAEMRQEKYEKE